MSNELPALLNVQQAAEKLSLSPRAVQHRIATGRIAATKVGEGRTSSYVITAAEIERVLAAGHPTSEAAS